MPSEPQSSPQSLAKKSAIDLAAVEKAAKLGRIELDHSEANELTGQLQNVLANFEMIAKIDTTGVEPLVTPSDIETQWREDVAVTELSAEEITANAPSRQGNLFSVPPVV